MMARVNGNEQDRLGAAVERVWPDGDSSWEVLGGGITNHNVKVARPDGVFVLRVAGRETDVLGIDRSVEHAATRAAAEVGVGPRVVRFVEPEGWLVTEFVEGAIPPPERLRETEQLVRVAAAIRAFHDGPAIPGRFEALEVVESYRDTALERGATLPDAFADAHELAVRIAHRRAAAERRPCHNDLLNANFIDDGELLTIVDWEYAGMGDPFFDLANFAVNHELDANGRAALLVAYAGEVDGDDVATLDLMRFMSDFREAMWGVVQGVVSELDFDFDGYAAQHFERMQHTAAEPGFQRGLT
jgi:thiamine kinase-like enzyme